MTNPPSRPWRLRRILLWVFLVFVGLLISALVFENIRGYRKWQKFRKEWEAKGERFDTASVIPKQVPPEENFATTPFFAPYFDYEVAVTGETPSGASRKEIVWKDRAAFERNKELAGSLVAISGRDLPRPGYWDAGQFTDLRPWQEYFKGNTNFPFAPTQGDPARDVLTALGKFDALLTELQAASRRPHSVFPVHYWENVGAQLPHLSSMKGIAQILQLRTVARLEAGLTSEALEDAKLGLRLSEALKSEPFLISQVVRIAMLHFQIQPMWEGLARHRWNETQLAELQAALSNVKLLEDYGRTMRGERAFNNDLFDRLRAGTMDTVDTTTDENATSTDARSTRFMPSGFYYHNQVTVNQLYQKYALPIVDAEKHRVFVAKAAAADYPPELEKRFRLYNIFAMLLYPSAAKSSTHFAYNQTTLDQAVIACALERHRLAHGQFPETLEALGPKFLAKPLTDVIDGEPLRYRRTDDGLFVLYSIGWNETDDGGTTVLAKKRIDTKLGDWVWRYPAKEDK